MDDRKLLVLRAIISDYVSSQEPVGSKTLVERHNLGVSSATIRNDMAALEDEGYIMQPHTSAGRIPTDKGYRLFVDRLGSVKPLSAAEQRAIHRFMSGAVDLDDILHRTVRLLAQVTHQVAIVQYPTLNHSTVRHVELVSLATQRLMVILITSTGRIEQRVVEAEHDEEDLIRLRRLLNASVVGQSSVQAAARLGGLLDELPEVISPLGRGCIATLLDLLSNDTSARVVVGGMPNLTRFGDEFETSVRPVLEALEEQVVLLKLLGEAASTDTVTVRIGRENPYEELRTTSMITAGYGSRTGAGSVSDSWATLGVVGPTRMDYPATISSVRAVARYVGRFLTEG